MADINLLSNDDAKKNGKAGAAKAPGNDEMALHVPAAEPEPPTAGAKFSPPPAPPKPAPPAPASILSQKVQPMAPPPPPLPPKPPAPKPQPAPLKMVVPLPPKPAPRPSPPPPKPPTPPRPPAPPPPPPDKDGSGTLRVSLITSGAGAGLSEVALARRLRAFALFGLLGLIIDGLIFGGLAYEKSVVEKHNSTAQTQVESYDARIVEAEKTLAPIREFQQLTLTEDEVLRNHEHWTGVLKLLEDDAMPQVRFGSLSGADTGALSFEVQARDYTTLAKQIIAFRQDPNVVKVTAGTASADFGEDGLLKGVHSELQLAVDPSIFHFTPQK